MSTLTAKECNMDIVKIIIFGFASFGYMFVIAKILGKKQIAELDFIDYVVGISLGSIAANWATELETPWYFYFIGMTIFLLSDITVTLLSRTLPFFKKTLQGSPLVVIHNGKLDYANIKKAKISVNDILAMARSSGYFNLRDIAYAVFETNGRLSILPVGMQKPTTIADLMEKDALKPNPPSIPAEVIIDGRIVEPSLENLSKSTDWLLKKLEINQDGVKDILLATYYEDDDEFDVHYKNKEPIADSIK